MDDEDTSDGEEIEVKPPVKDMTALKRKLAGLMALPDDDPLPVSARYPEEDIK